MEFLEQNLTLFERANYPFKCKVIDHVLSKEECEQWIDEYKDSYELATINSYGQQVVDETVRNCYRRFVDDAQDKVTLLWNRIREHVPDAERLNDRLRFLRYTPGQYFKPHYDNISRSIHGFVSKYTLQLYLNDDFEGGETAFFGDDEEWKVAYRPKQGSVLIFDQALRHSGEMLIKGTKYCVRTDILGPDSDYI